MTELSNTGTLGGTTHICLYSYRDFSWFDRANVTANIVIMDVKWFAILVCISLLASGHVGFWVHV